MKATQVGVLLLLWLVGPRTIKAEPYQGPDAWITAKAKLALWTNAGIRTNAVKIDTSDGTVTLYGNVDSASQRKEANDLIVGIEGVKHVQDLLQIVTPNNAKTINIGDERIKTEVNQALRREPALKGSSLAVQSVAKGVILLTGTAETMSDQLLAFLVADSADGVRRVVSEIKAPGQFMEVESKRAGELAKASKSKLPTSANDMRITTEIKLRFLADNDTPALSISVDTNRSRVSLFGAVASQGQSDRAKSVAQQVGGVTRSTPGARSVEDELVVE